LNTDNGWRIYCYNPWRCKYYTAWIVFDILFLSCPYLLNALLAKTNNDGI